MHDGLTGLQPGPQERHLHGGDSGRVQDPL